MFLQRTPLWPLRGAVAFATAALVAGCAGGGQSGVMMPAGNSAGTFGAAGSGNTVVKIFLPNGVQLSAPPARSTLVPPSPGGFAAAPMSIATPPPAAPTAQAPAATGSQVLAFNVSGPTTISQSVTVGPNSGGCGPTTGGTTCQLALTLPAGTYTGTVGANNGGSEIAFTVAPGGNNALNLTLGGVPDQIAIVPASFMSATNAQGGIDLYGAGKHPLLVELLDANQNVIIGGGNANYSLTQAGGSMPLGGFASRRRSHRTSSTSRLRPRATQPRPCSTPAQVISARRIRARRAARPAAARRASTFGRFWVYRNSNAASVTLYVNGTNAPLVTIQNGISNPQALIFDAAGDLFVANQPGSVSVYAPPYTQPPTTIANGVNHPQGLALDGRGNLFVANGNGSNTVTMYSPPYGGSPAATISSSVDDPVGLALDNSDDLFVVNERSEYRDRVLASVHAAADHDLQRIECAQLACS